MACVRSAIVFILFSAFAASAQAQSANGEAAMVLRVLNYDRALAQRAPGRQVTVLALYDPSDASSQRFCQDLSRAIAQLGRAVRVGGKQVRARPVPFATSDDLVARARSERAAGVYVCPGLAEHTTAIAQATRAAQLLSMTPAEEQVRDGLTVGLVHAGSQLRLFVNVTAAREEGARLDAALLRLATVLR